MNDAEIARLLTAGNRWWRDPQRWADRDPDLRRLHAAPVNYAPDPLAGIAPDGLYVLRGPRRVGKSVEIKRTIERLLADGIEPRRVLHCSCDGLTATDLRRLVRVGRDQLTRQVVQPRYWLLDEITAVPDWPQAIKWLRDNTAFAEDCVVLTGSSGRDLEEARKQLADRRGRARDSDRLLLPMDFRAFVRALGVTDLPEIPTVHPHDFLDRRCQEAVDTLLPWLDELASLWEVHCRIGGFPRAVADHIQLGDVDASFVNGLWDVIHGDALARDGLSAVQSLHLMRKLALDLASPVNMTAVAAEVGVASHHTAARRIRDLVDAYLVWPCHRRGDRWLPNLRAQSKLYFTDPLLARIAHLRTGHLPEPDVSRISEQQIGLALVRRIAAGDPGRYADFAQVMYTRSGTGAEVDFCGEPLGAVAFEGKYTDVSLARGSQTMRTMFGGRGVLATRAKLEQVGDARAMPAAFVAYLLGV
ncbi:MAG TPA: AAA family ATPase [Conexibacter sp.]|nr:AAA family ATPase [Conexibacter sp.]